MLGGQATACPKAGTGTVEMIRHLKVARDTAVKARTQAMLTLKAIIVNAPAALREQLEAITGKMALVRHLAALRPGPMTSTDGLGEGQPARPRPSLARRSTPRSRATTPTSRP